MGPLIPTPHGKNYIVMLVEHFSKCIEFVVLPKNSSELTSNAFLDRVLAQLGAHVEI